MPASKHRRQGKRRSRHALPVHHLPGRKKLFRSMIGDACLRDRLGNDWLDRELDEDEVATLAERLVEKGYGLD